MFELAATFLEAFVERLSETGCLTVPPEDLRVAVDEAARELACSS